MAILNVCKAHGGELVNEIVCKGCKNTSCRHAGELTTAERLYGTLKEATTMKCHYCNETIKTLHHDTEGNPICRKCYSYYSKCNACGEVWYRDRLINGTCEDCVAKREAESPTILLTLDTYARSAQNRLYEMEVPSVEAGMAIVKHLVEENFVGFDYETACDHKIYIAYISRVNKQDQKTRLCSSSDGLSWQ